MPNNMLNFTNIIILLVKQLEKNKKMLKITDILAIADMMY